MEIMEKVKFAKESVKNLFKISAVIISTIIDFLFAR